MANKNKLDLIHVDEHLILVNKPANVLSVPDRFVAEIPNLYHQLKLQYGEIFIVHRLDKATSGIICFARNEAAHKSLNQQFEARTTRKIYHALLEGVLHQKSGSVDKPLAESKARAGKMIIANRGKESLTHYKVLEEFDHYTLVECEIKTGRMHQIRVHMESIGHPLAVDPLYGRRDALFLSDFKRKKFRMGKNQEERPLLMRTPLHAKKLQLDHPETGVEIEFEAELHKDFRAILQQLRKWDNSQR